MFLANIDMTISGKVNFKGVNRILPTPSCLFVKIADVSRMDAPSTVIASKRFDLSEFDTSIGFYEYEITAKKPAKSQLWKRYGISATVHVGRCPDKRQSVRDGDILTDTHHKLELTTSKNNYKKNINTICYSKLQQLTVIFIIFIICSDQFYVTVFRFQINSN